jgi:hypothetical protein
MKISDLLMQDTGSGLLDPDSDTELNADLNRRVQRLESDDSEDTEPYKGSKGALMEATLWMAGAVVLWIVCSLYFAFTS